VDLLNSETQPYPDYVVGVSLDWKDCKANARSDSNALCALIPPKRICTTKSVTPVRACLLLIRYIPKSSYLAMLSQPNGTLWFIHHNH
jgi:hypothetical protein